MKMNKWVTFVCVLALTGSALAVYTDHIGYTAGATVYVKGPRSGGPDNSPLHESWNLTDQMIDGNPNPNYLGLYYRFIFYDGTLHIDPTGKVGFTEKIFASGNDPDFWNDGVPQKGTVIVEGELFGAELRPWKNGCPMTLEVKGDGILTLSNILRIGVSDSGVNTGVFHMSGGVTKVGNLDIYGAESYIDVTGGELLVLNSNKSVDDINAWINSDAIINSSGEGLLVQVKNIDGADYTSVMLIPEPLAVIMLALGAMTLKKRKHA